MFKCQCDKTAHEEIVDTAKNKALLK